MLQSLVAAGVSAFRSVAPRVTFGRSASVVTVRKPSIVRDCDTGDLLCKFSNVAPGVAALLMPTADSKHIPFIMMAETSAGEKVRFFMEATDGQVAVRTDIVDHPDGTTSPISLELAAQIVNRYNSFAINCNRAAEAFARNAIRVGRSDAPEISLR